MRFKSAQYSRGRSSIGRPACATIRTLNNDKAMRILVTGGAGFIGSHLCDSLLEQGNDVICLDNLYTGQKRNIEQHLGNDRFTWIEHDINAPLPDEIGEIDQIYNLASPASPVSYQKDPVFTTKTNVVGMINVLEAGRTMRAQGLVKVLQASTSEVYGDPLEHPQGEEYHGNVNTLGPRACYDEGKRCAETLCMDYYRQHALPVSIARIFNTYGPRMQLDDGRVVSNFITQALAGEKITVYGDGSQTRSFMYVDDLVPALIKLMESDTAEPVNLGNPHEITVKELAEKVIELTGSKSDIVYSGLPADDPVRRCPDIGRAAKILKWKPEISLEDGLKKTIEYFKTIV